MVNIWVCRYCLMTWWLKLYSPINKSLSPVVKIRCIFIYTSHKVFQINVLGLGKLFRLISQLVVLHSEIYVNVFVLCDEIIIGTIKWQRWTYSFSFCITSLNCRPGEIHWDVSFMVKMMVSNQKRSTIIYH